VFVRANIANAVRDRGHFFPESINSCTNEELRCKLGSRMDISRYRCSHDGEFS